jgi:thiosulfate reductase cytochrome b subunit
MYRNNMKNIRGYIIPIVIFLSVFVIFNNSMAIEDSECFGCHGDKNFLKESDIKGWKSLYISEREFKKSVHGNNGCISCHQDIDEIPHEERLKPVYCNNCHSGVYNIYVKSIHGREFIKGDKDVATCHNCHGDHYIKLVKEPESMVYPLNLPLTCGKCHGNEKLAKKHNIPIPDAYQKYLKSVHGKGLLKSGLILVSATCNDCHGTHDIKSIDNPQSTLFRPNVPSTCGKCHVGVVKEYKESIHGVLLAKGNKSVPVCTDCHATHEIKRTDKPEFKLDIIRECGGCHKESMETYRETYHGQVTSLGYTSVARCSDCHGYHNILPKSDPRSMISKNNIINTCKKCHEKTNNNFVKYMPHANHKDRKKYPILYYTWLFMTFLIIGVFAFFGVHTLIWLPKSLIHRFQHIGGRREEGEYYWRINYFHRIMHGFVIVSFLGLSLTGLPLKFSNSEWAITLSKFMGGFETAGFIHRLCGAITIFYFISHICFLIWFFTKKLDKPIIEFLFGPESMIPTFKDIKDIWTHFKWFIGKEQKPKWDRWTYWEKFDYWAVFWGVAVIGGSGIILWFKSFFSRLLPGWMFNMAFLIHSEEALLATAFIFIVHFFNTHLRPEKFPLDPVIFTGRLSGWEFSHERPSEYERLLKENRLESISAPPPPLWLRNFARIVGFGALGVGVILLIFMVITGIKSII